MNTGSQLLEIAQTDPEQYRAIRAREELKGMSPTDVVRTWFRYGLGCPLRDSEEEIKNRWETARALFLDGKTYTKIQNKLIETYNISRPQASIDIRNATELFAVVDKITKDAHRLRAIEMALMLFKKSKDAGAKVKALKAYIVAAGLDKDDPDIPNIEKIMADRVHALVLDDTTRDALLMLADQGGGSIDVSQFFARMPVTDIPHEPVDHK